jgi:Flp pilus assembly CpaF family ATPase
MYVPDVKREKEDDEAIIWNAQLFQSTKRTHCSAERFEQIFNETMQYIMTTEHHMYEEIQRGLTSEQVFINWLKNFFNRMYPEMRNPNDYAIMYKRLHTAIFEYYVLQPLIDHEDTSDIKVCGPKDIRVRVKGKAYRSSSCFIDELDLFHFVEGVAIRNGLNFSRPMITFTDNHDKNYLLRFLISAPMVNAVDYPYLHIRKVPKVKPTFEELIEAKMMPAIVRDYLIDRAKTARCVVFAGPPGSGKTTGLNAWIEYIPKTREVLVIQENDELFTKQSGFMFKHVTHGYKANESPITLEDLGKMALVEGCNEFIIGEVKGGEMRSVMTLLNAGGYSALTVHSTNARETMDKLADLVKYGSDYSFDDARKMLKTIDTIVYMEQYQVQEILEVKDYDLDTHQYVYEPIYKNEHPRWEEEKTNELSSTYLSPENPEEEKIRKALEAMRQ